MLPTTAPEITQLLRTAQPCLWTNPQRDAAAPESRPAASTVVQASAMHAAAARFERFAPLLAALFPELQASYGAITAPLVPAPALGAALGLANGQGALWVQCDHLLPVAGSIKARGGIHEVLEFAETVALEQGLIAPGGDYKALAAPAARAVFARYQVAVGSTGNLGLSIGVMAAALGFRAAVHMSMEAKAWKKERLRRRGVEVVEHSGDYEQAVAAGRALAAQDPFCHFVDDERSLSLLQGYSAAAPALARSLAQAGIAVDAEHPLFVYLPCGVGGAPAGIAWGLRQVLGPHVHCFFAEPVQAPCFLVQMLAAPGEHPSVRDWGLTNQTEADGLAVPRASLLAADLMRPVLSGAYTVQDETLFQHLALAHDLEGLRIEPSAAAGLSGPAWITGSPTGQAWLKAQGLWQHLPRSTHIAWTTGGLFVPEAEYAKFLQRGRARP